MSVSALAQKEYVNVVADDVFSNYHDIYLSGAIPAGMKSFYDGFYDRKTVGEIINILADNGFTVEQVSSNEAVKSSTASYTREVVLMSKPKGTPYLHYCALCLATARTQLSTNPVLNPMSRQHLPRYTPPSHGSTTTTVSSTGKTVAGLGRTTRRSMTSAWRPASALT